MFLFWPLAKPMAGRNGCFRIQNPLLSSVCNAAQIRTKGSTLDTIHAILSFPKPTPHPLHPSTKIAEMAVRKGRG